MNEMYTIIENLCKKHGINITQMCREADIPRGNLTDLKNGRTAALSTKNLGKISTYFGVSMELLLGKEDKKETPQPSGRDVTFDDFTYAMYEESRELTEENRKKLLEMAQFFKLQQEKDDG